MSTPDFALVPPRAEPSDIETALHTLYASSDALRADLDGLVIQIERIVKERAHIIDVLRTFYRSDVSISSLTPVLDLCVELGAVTKPEPR